MKNLVVRIVFALTLLLALGAVFGGVNSVSAHAATSNRSPAMVKPATNPVDCAGRSDFFKIYASTTYCFANAGSMNVNIDNATSVCGGNNSGYVVYDPYNTVYVPRGGCVAIYLFLKVHVNFVVII